MPAVLLLRLEGCCLMPGTRGHLSIRALGDLLHSELSLADVGHGGCPVILLGHSLGGLAIKALCTEAHRQGTGQTQQAHKAAAFCASVRLACFIATPHLGATTADFVAKIKTVYGPAPVTLLLTTLNADAACLTREFGSVKSQNNIRTLGFVETSPKVAQSMQADHRLPLIYL